MPHEDIPFWNFNVPPEERITECPDFLVNVSEKDKGIIGTWDADYERLSWEKVKELISRLKYLFNHDSLFHKSELQ